MERSAGICIIYGKRMLLAHPTGLPQYGSYSFPKGHLEEGEDYADAAIREMYEECGIRLDKSMLSKDSIRIPMFNRKKEIWKTVDIFIVRLKSLSQIGIKGIVVPKEMLKQDEIDYAIFCDADTCETLLHPRYKEFIKLIE